MNCLGEFSNIINEVSLRYGFSTDLFDVTTATITFDDGFINQYEIAGVFLHKYDIPAVIFVAGDAIDSSVDNALITEKLLLWTYFAPEYVVGQMFGEIASREELWVRYIQPKYRADWKERGKSFLRKLEEKYPVDKILKSLPSEWARLRLCGVKQSQLEELRKWGWMVGWHTKTHFPLAFLDEKAKSEELSAPEPFRNEPLCYPYGDIDSVGEDSIRIASELAYPCALSNEPDFSKWHGRFFMMRMALSPDKYELHFVLSGLKYFIKYKKLLPSIKSKHAK